MKPDFSCTASRRVRMSSGNLSMAGVGKRFAVGWVMKRFRLGPHRHGLGRTLVDDAVLQGALAPCWNAWERQRSGFFNSEKRSGSSPCEGCSIGASYEDSVRAEGWLTVGSLGTSRCEVAPRQRSSTALTKWVSWPAVTDGEVAIVASLRGS